MGEVNYIISIVIPVDTQWSEQTAFRDDGAASEHERMIIYEANKLFFFFPLTHPNLNDCLGKRQNQFFLLQ